MDSSKATRSKERAKAKWEKLTDEDLNAVTEGASALAARLADRYGTAFGEARDQAEEFLDSANEMAASAYSRAAKGTTAASSFIDDTVRDNPWRALLGAALVGTIVGFGLGSSRHRSYR